MIGKLRHPVYIIRPAYKDDGSGGQLPDGETRRPAWAHITKAQGTEALSGGAVTNAKSATLIMRAADIKPSDFILLDGYRWNISNIEPYQDGRAYLLISIRLETVSGA